MTSKKFTTTIEEAERAQVGAVEQSKKNLEEANAFAIAAKQELEEAEELVEDVERHWTVGNDSFSTADWSEARAKHRRAALRVHGSAGKIRKAEKGIVNGEKSLASAVAAVLRPRVADGVEVESTFVKDFHDRPSDHELPYLLVNQTGPTENLGNGCIAGKVTLTYYRTHLHSPFNPDEFPSHALGKVGAHFQFDHFSEGENFDRVDVTVHSIASPDPVIPSIESFSLKAVGQNVAHGILRDRLEKDEKIRVELPSLVAVTNKLKARTNPYLIVNETVEGTERTLVLDVPILWQRRVEKLEGPTVESDLDRHVTNEAGTFIGNVGWIKSAEIVTESDLWDTSPRGTSALRKALETEERDFAPSWEGFGVPGQIVVRYTIKSRVS